MGADWTSRLSRSVSPIRGDEIHTLADARDFILALPPGQQNQEDWQRTAELLIVAAESGRASDLERATFRFERSLLFQRLRTATR
jgi:hypothetical protein